MFFSLHIDERFRIFPKALSPGCIDPLLWLLICLQLYHRCPENKKCFFLFVVDSLRSPHTACSRNAYCAGSLFTPVNQILRLPDHQISASIILSFLPTLSGFNPKIRCDQKESMIFRVSYSLHSRFRIQNRFSIVQILPVKTITADGKINLFAIFLFSCKMYKYIP